MVLYNTVETLYEGGDKEDIFSPRVWKLLYVPRQYHNHISQTRTQL
jgi:hypothetical protein